MTGRPSLKILSCILASVWRDARALRIPIETPIAAKLDVSAFRRVYRRVHLWRYG